jgi:hypothetical protein
MSYKTFSPHTSKIAVVPNLLKLGGNSSQSRKAIFNESGLAATVVFYDPDPGS